MSSYVPEIYIKERNGIPMTNSLDVAEKFGKRHDNVLTSIRRIIADAKGKGLLHFQESSYLNDNNKRQPMFYMTRAGFSVLAMGFTGQKALEWKFKYEEQFSLMEAVLLNHKNLSWQQTRKNGIGSRLEETDTIKEFIEYAKAQGSSKAEWYYRLITTATYKSLFIINDKYKGKFRDLLDSAQLSFLSTAECVAQKAISDGMKQGLFYKDIFQLAKKRIETVGAAVGATPVVNHQKQFALPLSA